MITSIPLMTPATTVKIIAFFNNTISTVTTIAITTTTAIITIFITAIIPTKSHSDHAGQHRSERLSDDATPPPPLPPRKQATSTQSQGPILPAARSQVPWPERGNLTPLKLVRCATYSSVLRL